ncbi:hypothetical protein ACTI_29600 [Actinoplanes sp. OR16]|nr:hypothetical protein ACTI_29600 [Actinoplanes sp. OR16]
MARHSVARDELVLLARDPSPAVRNAVAKNPHTPREVLCFLTADGERRVQVSAFRRLARSHRLNSIAPLARKPIKRCTSREIAILQAVIADCVEDEAVRQTAQALLPDHERNLVSCLKAAFELARKPRTRFACPMLALVAEDLIKP